MPEYRALRKKHRLLDMFHTEELIVDVTRLPERLLGIDALILFSDILTVLDGLGVDYDFIEGKGPVISWSGSLKRKDASVYAPIQKAILRLKEESPLPLIGFAGAPFTVASYLLEGGSSKELKKTRKLLYSDPEKLHAILRQITNATIDYLQMQQTSGVDALQLFDSWAMYLTKSSFREFSLPYLKEIIQAVDAPVILFARGSSFLIDDLVEAKPRAISVDWHLSISELRKRVPKEMAIQGNLDPALLLAPFPVIQKQVGEILTSMQDDPGFIFNLGHGITPDVPMETVIQLVQHVQRVPCEAP